MTHLTDDELDEARVVRAVANLGASAGMMRIARQVALLARVGWTPPKQVDPAREAVKEALAVGHDALSFTSIAQATRAEKGWAYSNAIDVATASLRKSGVLK